MKTNDVTGRLGRGLAGFVVELGRPSIGARFHEIEKVSRALATAGVVFEEKNPITGLMTDVSKGTLDPGVLKEKVMSAIIEFRTPLDRTDVVLRVLEVVAEDARVHVEARR